MSTTGHAPVDWQKVASDLIAEMENVEGELDSSDVDVLELVGRVHGLKTAAEILESFGMPRDLVQNVVDTGYTIAERMEDS